MSAGRGTHTPAEPMAASPEPGPPPRHRWWVTAGLVVLIIIVLVAAGTGVAACADPHDAEIFGTFRLTGATWPGDSTARQQAASGCESRLSGYLNPQLDTSNLTQSYVYPGQQAWTSGQRTVVCEVRSASGQLTGSVRHG